MKSDFLDYPVSPVESDYTAYSSFSGPCGDTIEFFIKINGTKIEKIEYSSRGCVNTRRCAMAACRLVKGKNIEEASSITADDIEREAGSLPPDGKHCAELAETAIKLCLDSILIPLGKQNLKNRPLSKDA